MPVGFPHEPSRPVTTYRAKLFLIGTEPDSDQRSRDKGIVMLESLGTPEHMNSDMSSVRVSTSAVNSRKFVVEP